MAQVDMNDAAPAFQLEPPKASRRTAGAMVASLGITRAAFARWNVEPDRKEGRETLFSLAAVLENRLAHDARAAAEAKSTDEIELERLTARRDLLAAQIRALSQQIAEIQADHCERKAAREALPGIGQAAAAMLEPIPAAILEKHPELARHGDWLNQRMTEILEPLRALTLE